MHRVSAFAVLCSWIVAVYLFVATAMLNHTATTSADGSR
jgi:hypothetical protein